MLAQTVPITGDPFYIGASLTFVHLALLILALVPVIRKRKQGVQSLNKAFIIWLLLTLISTQARFAEYFLIMTQGGSEGALFSFGASLNSWYFIPLLSIMGQFQFVLYILRKFKFYSLPVILLFFVSLGLFQYHDTTAYNLIVIPISYVTLSLFMRKGMVNRDGFLFAIGMFALFDYGNAYFTYSLMRHGFNLGGSILYVVMHAFAVFAVAFLNLGTWGWLDKHVFYDKEREKQIKNAWVSRLIEIEKKKPDVKKTAGRSILLECPVCHRQGRKHFSHEVVLERAKNEKGIVKMLLNQEKEICDHQFVVYLDRSFTIRGYEPIDMMV